MSNAVDVQLAAFGVAQVIVILKEIPTPAAAVKMSAALAAATPVAAARSAKSVQTVVMELAKHFRFSERGPDTALALEATSRNEKSVGASWFKKAKSAANPTPAARYFPNLGVMFGTVDKAGLDHLQANDRVANVTAPPVMSLIRPVAAAAVKPAKQFTWGIKRLKADRLHKAGGTGAGVIVGHLDTGADGTHPALKKAFHAFAEFDDFGFQVSPDPAPHDSAEHGTHTAGTIAGRTATGHAIGMAPEALLASAMVIESGNATARILAGMDWIIGQGARILSMSLGFRGFTEDFLALTQLLRTKGVLPVFAVGNEGAGFSRSPGNYAEALSVGAMGPDETVAEFSCSQQFARPDNPLVPDVVAPGVGVVSAKPTGGYQKMDGTSMATPHIAGLAALLMGAEPSKTIDEIEQAIFDSCTPLAGEPQDRQNRGVPDAVKALELLQE